MPKKQDSEFGKGFVYNLVLFAKHWGKIDDSLQGNRKIREAHPNDKEVQRLFTDEHAIEMWFYAAGDHFYELEVPPQWKKKKIGKLADSLMARAFKFRMVMKPTEPMPTKKDFDQFFEDLELLTMLIDKELGIKPIKASWN